KARLRVSSRRKSSSESPSALLRRYSASARMCCRMSVPKRDILHLVQDAWAHVGAQALGREQLDSSLQQFFEEEDEAHEVVEALFLPPELDQEVDVAVCNRLPAREGAEETELLDAQGADLLSVLPEPAHHVVSRGDCPFHIR